MMETPMDNFVFVSVAFGERYILQQDRLKQSILKIYPDANFLFYRDELPATSRPFLDSLYGFKPHAVRDAIAAGYKKILWLDPAMILCDKIDILLGRDVVAVKDQNKLSTFIWDKYLDAHGLTRKKIDQKKVHLVGGSVYYFDIDMPDSLLVFRAWELDELNGWFGTQELEATVGMNGHRADETCMAMNMHRLKIKPVEPHEIKYCTGSPDDVFIKKHFK
jgi:hypothetical protein